MRILLAFVCMGFLGTVAAVLALVQVLARAWPALIIVMAVVAAARWRNRRARKAAAPVTAPLAVRTVTGRRPTTTQPISARPSAWVLVPVWMDAQRQTSHHHPVMDGDVITGEVRHG